MEQQDVNRRIKVKFFVGVGLWKANQEEIVIIEDKNLDITDKDEVDSYLNEYLRDWANNYIQMGYEILEEN